MAILNESTIMHISCLFLPVISILFLIYIRSIPASVLKGKLFIFVDDQVLVNADDSQEKFKANVEVTESISMIGWKKIN